MMMMYETIKYQNAHLFMLIYTKINKKTPIQGISVVLLTSQTKQINSKQT